jgi:hypothetical protein
MSSQATAVAVKGMAPRLQHLPRLVQINKNLEALQLDVQVVRGAGYFYVIGKDTEHSSQTSIYVKSVYQLTMDQWISEVLNIVGETLNYRGSQS